MKQEELLREGQEVVERCLQIAPECFYAYKWAAVFISALVGTLNITLFFLLTQTASLSSRE